MSDREKEVLVLTARGLSRKEIAAKLSLSPGTIATHKKHAFNLFGATDSTNAVLLALNQSKLTYEEVTDGWDRNALSKLTPREIEIVDAMTRNNGENNSSKEIGDCLFVSPRTVKTHLQSIMKKTNMNRIQISVLYYIWNKRKQILYRLKRINLQNNPIAR